MNGWQRPLGPETSRTYWLRRALVIAVALAVVIAVVAGAWRVSRRPSPAASPAGAPSPTQSAAASPSSSAQPSATSSPSGSTPAPTTSSPTPSAQPTPGPCAGDGVTLSLAGDRDPRSTETARWTVTLTNVGEVACHAEVSPDTTALTVTSGAVRVWSTRDCGEWLAAPAARWLEPGQALEWDVEWPTRLSSGNCQVSPQYLKPGTYVARVSLADATPASLVVRLRG